MTQLTLAQANHMINAALEHSKTLGYKPMAVVVLDEAGHVKATQREDGASMFRVDVATGKAWPSSHARTKTASCTLAPTMGELSAI